MVGRDVVWSLDVVEDVRDEGPGNLSLALILGLIFILVLKELKNHRVHLWYFEDFLKFKDIVDLTTILLVICDVLFGFKLTNLSRLYPYFGE